MHEIADYCDREFMEKDALTTAFIRGLHLVISPTKKPLVGRNAEGHLVVISVPGSYKTIPNSVQDSDEIFTPPKLVKTEMERIVAVFNAIAAQGMTTEAKREAVFRFALDLLSIHPFGDENGRVACILVDLLLVKAGLHPIYFFYCSDLQVISLGKICSKARSIGNSTPLLNFAVQLRPEAF